jgi:hypothetical protein
MDEAFRKVRRKPASAASASRGVPGSVMATNCRPGFGAVVSTRFRKYA